MEPAPPSWWRPDFTSAYAKERQAFVFFVTVPFLVGAFFFRLVFGLDYVISFIPAMAFAALGWAGLRARKKHRKRRP